MVVSVFAILAAGQGLRPALVVVLLSWRPTRARTGLGYPTELRWDSTWRRRISRPFPLWLYGAGELVLFHPGSPDATLWIFNASDFRRATKTYT